MKHKNPVLVVTLPMELHKRVVEEYSKGGYRSVPEVAVMCIREHFIERGQNAGLD